METLTVGAQKDVGCIIKDADKGHIHTQENEEMTENKMKKGDIGIPYTDSTSLPVWVKSNLISLLNFSLACTALYLFTCIEATLSHESVVVMPYKTAY